MKNRAKFFSFFVIAIVCFAGALAFTGCNFGSAKLVSISLDKDIKTTYCLNETIDLNDAKLIATYDDKSQKELTISMSMISGFDTTTTGQKVLTISYDTEKIDINYQEVDFRTVYNQTSDSLLNSNKFIAMSRRYDSENSSWYNYDKYTKYNNYLKVEDRSGSDSFLIYDLVNHLEYDSNSGSSNSTSMTQAQLYSYSYAFIDRNGEITDYNLKLAQDSYTLTYKLNQDSSIYDVEAIVNSDFTIRTITVKMNGQYMMQISYVYDNIPEITMPQ